MRAVLPHANQNFLSCYRTVEDKREKSRDGWVGIVHVQLSYCFSSLLFLEKDKKGQQSSRFAVITELLYVQGGKEEYLYSVYISHATRVLYVLC